MKKLAIAILLLGSIQPFLYAQSIFDDALAIKRSMVNIENNIEVGPSITVIASLFNKYADVPQLNGGDVFVHYNNRVKNPYFLQLNLSAGTHFGAIAGAGTADFLPFPTPGFASLDVTTLADGLARFLADRTKKELHAAFFRHLKTVIDANREKELGILFPNTVINLYGAGDNVWKFDHYLETLREGFYQDLNALPGNLVFLTTEVDQQRNKSELIKLLKDKIYNSNRYLRPAIANTYEIAKMTFGEHVPLADVISRLGTMDWDTLEGSKTRLEDAFKISAFVSDCLLRTRKNSTAESGDWITMRDFSQLQRDPVLFQVFLALVYQQARNIQLSGEIQIDSSGQTLRATSMRTFLAGQKDKLINAREMLGKICARVNSIQEAALALRPDASASTASSRDNSVDLAHIQEFITIADNLVYLLEDGLRLAGLRLDKNEQKGIDCFRRVISIYTDVNTKSYALAISKTFNLIDELGKGNPDFAKFREGEFYRHFITFGTFMASVVRAETPEEVQAAIESVAMPVGSASVKKYSRFNVAMNAYVGGFGGGERLYLTQSGSSSDKRLLAPVATVGISAGWGLGKAGAISLYGSLVDLGALVAFRLQDSSTSDLPKLELRNIIAPGGYLVYGFPTIPISLGLGAQWGPALREVTVAGNTLSETQGWRWGVFLAVDIPVLNFYSSRKWKKG